MFSCIITCKYESFRFCKLFKSHLYLHRAHDLFHKAAMLLRYSCPVQTNLIQRPFASRVVTNGSINPEKNNKRTTKKEKGRRGTIKKSSLKIQILKNRRLCLLLSTEKKYLKVRYRHPTEFSELEDKQRGIQFVEFYIADL